MVVDHGRTAVWGTGMSCHSCLLRPKSRGEVTLNSSDPLDDPSIDPKFLSHPDDVKDLMSKFTSNVEQKIGNHREAIFDPESPKSSSMRQPIMNL